MNNRGFLFFYGISIILFLFACFILSLFRTLGILTLILIIFLQIFLYLSTRINNKTLIWPKETVEHSLLSHCSGIVENIADIKKESVVEILSNLNLNVEKATECYCVTIRNSLPHGPERRSLADGKIKIFNLLKDKSKRQNKDNFLHKAFKNYNFWYYLKLLKKNDSQSVFVIWGDASIQKERGLNEFIPIGNMFNDCSELIYPTYHGNINQGELVSAMYFHSYSVLLIPKKYFNLKIFINQTLVAMETIVGELIPENKNIGDNTTLNNNHNNNNNINNKKKPKPPQLVPNANEKKYK